MSFTVAVSVIGFGLRLLVAPAFAVPFGNGDWIAWLDIDSTAGAMPRCRSARSSCSSASRA